MNKIGRTFVCGDIHGAAKALLQVLIRSDFDNENDKLIILGDLTDGWSQSKEVIKTLMDIKNKIFIRGNHDQKAIDFYKSVMSTQNKCRWIEEDGGNSTLSSLGEDIKSEYLALLESSVDYHIEGTRLFSHAGMSLKKSFHLNDYRDFRHERHFIYEAFAQKDHRSSITDMFTEVYVGHVCTIHLNHKLIMPQKLTNVWAMDTGAGFEGCLSLMNVDTNEVYQSDRCMMLYPDEKGRNEYSFNQLENGQALFSAFGK